MPEFESSLYGDIDDRVRLRLAEDDEFLLSKSYTVEVGVFEQPAAFSLTVALPDVLETTPGKFRKKYPPRTPFELRIGDRPLQSGLSDGFPKLATSGGGTSITVKGRDAMAPLHDACVRSDSSFADHTYRELVEAALKASGVAAPKVVVDGFADRKLRTGINLTEIAPPATSVLVQELEKGKNGKARIVASSFQSKIGETWFEFIRRHIDRAGLFLWSGADGTYILSRPAREQAPIYQITRSLDPDFARQRGSIVSDSWDDDTTQRYSEVVIYGRYGGKKFGRGKAKGAYEDPEMLGWGYDRPLTLRDVYVQSPATAAYLAKRKLAESRRQGFRLSYTVAGHTVPSVNGNTFGVWSPDTIVHVTDELYDIDANFYIENVTFSRNPQTETTLRLMRPEDLVFGIDDELQ